MSNSNGRIYINTSTDPDTGISIKDIQTVLVDGSPDVGNLCKSSSINKWAKYKPVRHSNIGTVSDAERVAVNQGLSITKYETLASLTTGWENDYVYLQPRGRTNNEWFRMMDFNEYIHSAKCPVSRFTCVNEGAMVYEGVDLIARLYLDPTAPAGSILLSDLSPDSVPLTQYYWGVIIQNGSTYRIVTQSTPVGTTSASHQELTLTLPSSYFTTGNNYIVYPVFSYNPITTITTGGDYRAGLFSVPNTTPSYFHVYPITLVVSVGITDFSMFVGAGRYTWSITAAMQVNMNTTTTAEILYRIYDGAYDPETGTIGGSVVASGTFYYGQIAQAPNQTVETISGTIMGATPNYLTAVLSYQNNDYLPVTISSEDF